MSSFTSVKARMHQLESSVASKEHLSKHPEQLRKRQQKGRLLVESDSENEEDLTSDFAELLKVVNYQHALLRFKALLKGYGQTKSLPEL